MFYLPVQRKIKPRISAASSRAAIAASLFTRWPFLIQECKACQPLTHIKPECVKEWEERMGAGKKSKKTQQMQECRAGGGDVKKEE